MARLLARTIVSRLALVVGGVSLCLVLLEVALQVGALFVGSAGRVVAASWGVGALRVLCVGDSNTYGLRLTRELAYPAQLESIWNERGEGAKTEVFNLGYPGMNSSRLLRDSQRLLDTLQPDVVFAMIGANDFWTAPVEVGATDRAGAPWRWLKTHSRVFRLYALLRARFFRAELEIESAGRGGPRAVARYGGQEFELGFVPEDSPLAGGERELRRNLRALVAAADERGTTLVLLTYPAAGDPFYRAANRSIRAVARRTDTPLIDLNRVFAPRCPDDTCPDLLFRDQHPTAAGHRLAARAILPRLQALTAAEGRSP